MMYNEEVEGVADEQTSVGRKIQEFERGGKMEFGNRSQLEEDDREE